MHTTTTTILGLAAALIGATAPGAFASPNRIILPQQPENPQITPAAALVQARNNIAPINPRTPTTDPLYNECTSFHESVLDSLPTQPAEIDSWYETATEFNPPEPTTTTDGPATTQSDRPPNSDDVSSLCSMAFVASTYSPPAALATAWSSYFGSVSQWRSSAAPALSSQAAKCMPKYPVEAGYLLYYAATDEQSCRTAAGLIVGLSAEVTAETTGSGSSGAGATGGGNGAGAGPAATSSTSTGGAAGPRETGYVVAAAAAAVGAIVGAIGL